MDETAKEALRLLLEELPAEFSELPGTVPTRSSFFVIKERNVRTVHECLWQLQKHFGMVDDE